LAEIRHLEQANAQTVDRALVLAKQKDGLVREEALPRGDNTDAHQLLNGAT
jgi:hypothetical protein